MRARFSNTAVREHFRVDQEIGVSPAELRSVFVYLWIRTNLTLPRSRLGACDRFYAGEIAEELGR